MTIHFKLKYLQLKIENNHRKIMNSIISNHKENFPCFNKTKQIW